ncbi:hypothetical protein KQI69_00030 [Eubacterium sp. MSJ-13]|uniref:hypothetical protein n=1 Tax=Eubacterium sp. MSJ-13 TaxID=2841513 RepID=UPI001C1056BF|nr:hypothetical protein [Eubacterium sp. MSJ-13]MBU5477591.1 hypothetical protein [Eubacterium sp. MSJ-13]
MIEKNIVLIETLNNIGTGLLYPCDYKGKETENDENVGDSYILITNHHVLGYLPKINIKDCVKLTFYDDWGNLIDIDDICQIKLFENKYKSDNDEEDTLDEWDRTKDIVALLIILNRGIKLTLSTDIMFNKLENREKLYVEGYPGVLFEQEVNKRIQLEGIEKTIFPFNDRIGAYQITDDYHWYNDLGDRALLEGLSGSPLFVKNSGKEFILGINQSIANVDDGKNPFKIIYYLRIEYIINFLRENNCIIYKRVGENKIQIEWIYEQELKMENDITILMIGGSGAGKSSIAKNFALHGNSINSTNDGQTTRTDVIYKYSVTQKLPKATVYFLNQQKFVEQMLTHVDMYSFAFYFEKIFKLSKNFVTDEKKLMKNIFEILNIISDVEGKEEAYEKQKNQILCCLEDELVNKEKIKLYQTLLNIFKEDKYIKVLKYILDENEVIEARKVLMLEEENNYIPGEVFEAIEKIENWRNDFNFDEYRKNLIEKVVGDKSGDKQLDEQLPELINEYNKIILHCEGFFDLKDFEYILDVEDVYNLRQLESRWGNLTNQDDKNGEEYPEEDDDSEKLKIKLYNNLIQCYKKIHKIIKIAIQERYPFYDKPIRLDDATKETREFLSECLQVSNNRSLTGMVDNVQIQDKISNEYSFIFREFNINQLTLVDTCGLDHVETNSQKDIIHRLDNYYYEMNSKDCKWYEKTDRDRKVAVLFVKKLDAGKPDELRTIVPCIKKSIPKAPVYCMFTGIDIFYKSEQEVATLDWSFISNRCPKVVTYILDQNTELKNYMSDIQYIVLKNNIIPYCGKQSLIKEQFCFEKSNYKYIRKLIASISMKESSSLEILEWNEKLENSVKQSINEIIGKIFANASLDASEFRWNTINADVISGYKGNLGYCYTYSHYFYQLFHKAYVETMDSCAANILEHNHIYSITPIMSALYEIETKFLGNNENLYKIDIDEAEKNDFRMILEKMYACKGSDIKDGFKYNIFDKRIYEEVLSGDKKKMKEKYRDEFFNCVFGFTKGLPLNIEYNEKTGTVQEFLRDVLLKLLKEQIEKDNQKKSKNIVKISENYYKELQNIEKSFMQKYGIDDKGKFFDLMIRFFQNKKNEK